MMEFARAVGMDMPRSAFSFHQVEGIPEAWQKLKGNASASSGSIAEPRVNDLV